MQHRRILELKHNFRFSWIKLSNGILCLSNLNLMLMQIHRTTSFKILNQNLTHWFLKIHVQTPHIPMLSVILQMIPKMIKINHWAMDMETFYGVMICLPTHLIQMKVYSRLFKMMTIQMIMGILVTDNI